MHPPHWVQKCELREHFRAFSPFVGIFWPDATIAMLESIHVRKWTKLIHV